MHSVKIRRLFMLTNEKLSKLSAELEGRPARVMIVGLGSVGNYLLSYLLSDADAN